MGPIGHFAVGMLCGVIIMLPFLRDRSLYDYDKQRWVSIEWIPIPRNERRFNYNDVAPVNSTDENIVTYELNPLTKSKYMAWTPLVAVICGIMALMPDISHLWGDPSLDRSRFADLFFFHYTIDAYWAAHGFTMAKSLTVELPLLFITAATMLCLMAIAQDFQYNRKNLENCVY